MTHTSVQPKLPKGYKGMAMEGMIATWYAKTTLKDLEEYKILAKRIADELPEGSRLLEIAPGPGYLALELAKMGKYQVSGLEISETFVAMERQNAKQAGVEIDFRQGDVHYSRLQMTPSILRSAAPRSRTSPSRSGPLRKCIAFSSLAALR